MTFYPKVTDPRHQALIEKIRQICKGFSARCIDMVGYHQLPHDVCVFLKTMFNHEALWVRTLPDLYIHPINPPPFFLDAKTKANPKYKNVAIELSSFYWALRRSFPDFNGVYCGQLYATIDSEDQVWVFSPLLIEVSKVIIPLHHFNQNGRVEWSQTERDLFRQYALCADAPIIEKEIQAGSGDPFVLVSEKMITQHMRLEEFLSSNQKRDQYLKSRKHVKTSITRFLL